MNKEFSNLQKLSASILLGIYLYILSLLVFHPLEHHGFSRHSQNNEVQYVALDDEAPCFVCTHLASLIFLVATAPIVVFIQLSLEKLITKTYESKCFHSFDFVALRGPPQC